MKNNLENLKLSKLSMLEVGELAQRLIADLETGKVTMQDDSIFQRYTTTLNQQHANLQKALLQVRKHSDTQEIEKTDKERDAAFSALKKAVKLANSSDIETELIAAKNLSILLNNYKQVEKLNYEAETQALDKLTSELESSNYAPHIQAIAGQRYVDRLKNSNQLFKSKFGNRMTTEAFKESFDTTQLRNNLLATYSEFSNYVVAMVKATPDGPYANVLSIINVSRKYYSNLLATREGRAAVKRELSANGNIAN